MKGTVIETTGTWNEVKTDEGEYVMARLKGIHRLREEKYTNPVVVGDRVVLENTDEDHSIVISEIEPRKNQIIRQSPRKKRHYHVIAANIDQGLIMASLRKPKTKKGFISRVLVALDYYDIPAIVIFSKKDIYTKKDNMELENLQNDLDLIGYPSLVISSASEEGIEEVKEQIGNKINAITGPSGVGKSTLLNTLKPEADVRTKEVSNYNEKGQHTTTFSRMYELPFGGYLVDTPGIKEYGLAKIDAYELSFYFPEMEKRRSECRFNNCQHINEPGCAIIKATEEGEIPLWRYQSYVLIREELLIENKDYL